MKLLEYVHPTDPYVTYINLEAITSIKIAEAPEESKDYDFIATITQQGDNHVLDLTSEEKNGLLDLLHPVAVNLTGNFPNEDITDGVIDTSKFSGEADPTDQAGKVPTP